MIPLSSPQIMGERWKALEDAAKAPFHARAGEDKARYDAEMEAYRASPRAFV